MKKIATVLFALALALPALAQTPKILTVDLNEVFNKYWKARSDMEKFQEAVRVTNEQIQQMTTQLSTRAEELQALQGRLQSPATTETAKEDMRREGQAKAREFEELRRQIEQQRQSSGTSLQQKRQDILETHLRDIRETVIAIANEQEADLVLNSGNNVSAVIFAADEYDITETVVARLNRNQPSN